MGRTGLLIIAFCLFILACNNDTGRNELSITSLEGTDLNDVYFDYRIHGEEGDDNLTLMIQYRDGDEEGPTLLVEKPALVKLDDEVLSADSSLMTGAYYEVQKPIEQFTGPHRVSLVAGKTFSEEFQFNPLTLAEPLPDTLSRRDWVLDLEGLEPEDYVRILMMDTSFTSDGINRLDTVQSGRLLIRESDLAKLQNGDIQFELHREFERPVKNGTSAGGRLSITYVIKRRFVLKD